MNLNEYFSMQGKVYIGLRNADGTRQPARWVYDSSKLEWAQSVSEEEQDESWSGQRGLAATLKTKKGLQVNLTLGQLNTDNAARAMSGVATDVAAGTVTAEPIGDVKAGDVVALAYGAVSAEALKDGASAALVAGTDYTINADTGVISFLTAKTGVVASSYSYGVHSIVTALSQNAPNVYVVFDGENTVDGASMKVRGEVYNVVFNPASTMSWINDNFGSMELQGKARVDPFRQPDPKWGPFARVLMVDPNG